MGRRVGGPGLPEKFPKPCNGRSAPSRSELQEVEVGTLRSRDAHLGSLSLLLLLENSGLPPEVVSSPFTKVWKPAGQPHGRGV